MVPFVANKLIPAMMMWTALMLPPAACAQIAVVVNAANERSLDIGAVARIFLAQAKVYPGGSQAVSIDQKEGTKVREEFQEKLFQLAPPEIKSFWARQKFTGSVRHLSTFDNDEAILDYIEKTPNAIGYVDASKVTRKVRVLLKF